MGSRCRLKGCARSSAWSRRSTPLREGLDNILRARTGGLVVVGDVPEVLAIASGGFKLNADFSPAALYELAKMDGAIILSSTADRIVWANATLSPDPDIPSRETGLRHSTAERVAKMTGQLVIAISQRRSVITVYMGHTRYVLRDIGVVLAKANQALQTMANYKEVFSRALTNLSALEFIEEVTVADVVRGDPALRADEASVGGSHRLHRRTGLRGPTDKGAV